MAGGPLGPRETEVTGRGALDGQVALVTGGSSGIGAEVCARLARSGRDRHTQPGRPEAAYVSGTSLVMDGALETQVSLAQVLRS